MTETDNVIKIGKTIEITTHPTTMRRRDLSRKVMERLRSAPVERQTLTDFAIIVAYTKAVKGLDWTPPAPDAELVDLQAALDHWLDYIDPVVTDAWVNGTFPTKPTP